MLAKEFKMWIIFGMNEQTVDETKNYNTIVILNDQGELMSDYKKTLCLMHTNGKNQGIRLRGIVCLHRLRHQQV